MKNKCVPFLVSLFLICVACSSEQRGLAELKRLCDKDAGLTIYKTVEADGFYNAYSNNGITDYLIKGPYKFYEFCDDSPSLSIYNIFPEPGCFRVIKVNRTNGQCDDRIDKALSKRIVDPYPEFLQEYCIAVEKIEKPTAKYSYHSEPMAWFDKNEKSEFRRSESYVKDTLTDQIIGRYVSYSYNVKPRHSSPKSCHTIDDKYISYAEAKLIESVIEPIN